MADNIDTRQLELPRMDNMPKLELPRRWELLRERAEGSGVDITQFVERVDSAADHVDELLQKVRSGGGGLFEVFYGLSGSGKTTFLNTLPRFFTKIRVYSFGVDQEIEELPKFLRKTYISNEDTSRIILIERRDNPRKADIDKLSEMFGELLDVFRERAGSALVLWPVTNIEHSKVISEKAWDTGRDSMVLRSTKGLYEFRGVPKERYYELTDTTARNLTGDGLSAFGITAEEGSKFLTKCETIADFFSEADDAALKLREKTWSVLKARVLARLWVLLPGDDIAAVTNTVSSLTQGNSNRIDIDRIAEMVDAERSAALYLKFWKERRGSLAHLFRAIDVRLFYVAPNVALAAVRSCGDASVMTQL